MSANFIKGAINSYKDKKWDRFISQYGTCYATEVIMGGRATQEIIYSFKSASQMITSGISLQIAASASFKNFYSNADFNSSSNQEASSYAETYSNSIREFNVGAEPAKNKT